MGVEQLKIPCIVDNAAHQVTGLLVVEVAKMEAFQLIVGFGAQIAYQKPGGLVGQIVAQEAEHDAQKIQPHQQQRQQTDPAQGGFVHATLHNACGSGQGPGRSQIDPGKAKGGKNGDDVQVFVPDGFPAQTQQQSHTGFLLCCCIPWECMNIMVSVYRKGAGPSIQLAGEQPFFVTILLPERIMLDGVSDLGV